MTSHDEKKCSNRGDCQCDGDCFNCYECDENCEECDEYCEKHEECGRHCYCRVEEKE